MMPIPGNDAFVTGHYGQDQFMDTCSICDEWKYIDENCLHCDQAVCSDCMREHAEEKHSQEEEIDE